MKFLQHINPAKRQPCSICTDIPYFVQSRSRGLSSLPPFVIGTETLVAAGHVTTQNLGGRKICCKGGVFYRPLDQLHFSTLRFWMDRWSREQPQPGSLFQTLREAEKRDPGNEVVFCYFTSLSDVTSNLICIN